MKHHECLRCPSEASTASTAVDRDSPCADAKCAGKEDEISSIFFSASSVTARLQERVQGLEQELKRNRVRCALLKTALHQKRQVLTLAMQHLEPDGSSAFRAKLAKLKETWDVASYASGSPKCGLDNYLTATAARPQPNSRAAGVFRRAASAETDSPFGWIDTEFSRTSSRGSSSSKTPKPPVVFQRAASSASDKERSKAKPVRGKGDSGEASKAKHRSDSPFGWPAQVLSEPPPRPRVSFRPFLPTRAASDENLVRPDMDAETAEEAGQAEPAALATIDTKFSRTSSRGSSSSKTPKPPVVSIFQRAASAASDLARL